MCITFNGNGGFKSLDNVGTLTIFDESFSVAVDEFSFGPFSMGKAEVQIMGAENMSKRIKKVIFNKPATIVYWDDGTKTVVKCQKGDKWDKEKGLMACICKKFYGNKSKFNDVIKEWCGE